jgi:hypothetical protein
MASIRRRPRKNELTVTILPFKFFWLPLLRTTALRALRSFAHTYYAIPVMVFGLLVPAAACDVATVEILARLPLKDEPHPHFFEKAVYFDDEAQTDSLAALRVYWLARAGCIVQARAAIQDLPDADVYMAAAAMRRSGRVEEAGYQLLESSGRARMILPLLADPVNETYMLRYAKRPLTSKNDVRIPLEEVYHLLHEGGQYDRAVRLVDALGPIPDDDMIQQLRLAWAEWRVGRKQVARQRWSRLLHNSDIATIQANTLGSEGFWDEAIRAINRAPAKQRPEMLRLYLETTGDFTGVRVWSDKLPTCDQAWHAAMERQYIRAMDLADAGQCERIYNFVPDAPSHRLAQRYSAAGLYVVAAKRGDGMLFRHLATRAGVRDSDDYIVTSPVVLALVASGQDELGRRILLDDGDVKRFRLWHWNDVAHLADKSFGFEEWLDLALPARDTPSGDESLVSLGQAFALQQPERALQWFDSRRESMSAWQRKVLIFGMARGYAGATLKRCSTDYRPVAAGYSVDPDAPRPRSEADRKAQAKASFRSARCNG